MVLNMPKYYSKQNEAVVKGKSYEGFHFFLNEKENKRYDI